MKGRREKRALTSESAARVRPFPALSASPALKGLGEGESVRRRYLMDDMKSVRSLQWAFETLMVGLCEIMV